MLIKMGPSCWVNVGNARMVEIGKNRYDGRTVLIVAWLGDLVDHDDYRPSEYRFETEDLVKVARAKLNG